MQAMLLLAPYKLCYFCILKDCYTERCSQRNVHKEGSTEQFSQRGFHKDILMEIFTKIFRETFKQNTPCAHLVSVPTLALQSAARQGWWQSSGGSCGDPPPPGTAERLGHAAEYAGLPAHSICGLPPPAHQPYIH